MEHRIQRSMQRLALVGIVFAGGQAWAGNNPASLEQMWEVIQRQQQQIQELKRRLQETDQKVEVTGEMVERTRAQAHGGAAQRTHIGGYGELHYNNLSDRAAGGANNKDTLDFHRFVLFFGHQFNDRIRFASELELEHALSGDGEPGEVELEQAYVEMELADRHRAKAGVFLLPVGILNETHEPTTFYGTERNPVEKYIVPTTWWEGGAALAGTFAPGWSYDAAVHSGLKTSAGDNYAVRDGRQKVAKADARDLAATGRLRWTAVPGLELAASLQYQQDITQSSDASAGAATLFEAHADWQRGPFGMRALYATWNLDGSGPAAVGADEQTGWYVEPSWRIGSRLGVFGRYSVWDNRAGNGTDTERRQWDVGLNYWPHPDVVLKADYQNQDSPAGEDEFDGFNLGVGYQF